METFYYIRKEVEKKKKKKGSCNVYIWDSFILVF